jgi:amidase
MSAPAFPHVKPDRMNGPLPVYTAGLDVDGRTVDYGTATVGFTLPFSTTGSPVVAVPIGSSRAGMPIGAQVVGRRYADAALLRAATAVEAAAAPLIRRRPLIA